MRGRERATAVVVVVRTFGGMLNEFLLAWGGGRIIFWRIRTGYWVRLKCGLLRIWHISTTQSFGLQFCWKRPDPSGAGTRLMDKRGGSKAANTNTSSEN